MSEPFLAQIMPVAFTYAPSGWAFCNGQTILISQNQAIFSLLGTTYGGDGTTNFQLPNLQGRVAMHVGPSESLGQMGGNEDVTLAVNEIPAHAHTVSQPTSTDEETTNRPDGAYFTKGGAYGGSTASPAMGATASSPVGSSLPHSNLQPYLVLPFVIALQGVFPARN